MRPRELSIIFLFFRPSNERRVQENYFSNRSIWKVERQLERLGKTSILRRFSLIFGREFYIMILNSWYKSSRLYGSK